MPQPSRSSRPLRAAGLRRSTTVRTLVVAPVVLAAACSSPLDRSAEDALRDEVIAAHRRQFGQNAANPVIEVRRTASEVEQQLENEGRIEQLDTMSGPTAYRQEELQPGEDLLGRAEPEVVEITLERAIELAVKNNLDLKVASLAPAIAEQRVLEAEAVFDWTFFTDAEWQDTDTPRPLGGGSFGTSGDVRSEVLTINPGFTKELYSGGNLTLETALDYNKLDPSPFDNTDSYYSADVAASLSQPLLRGFGNDIARADILLTQNARQQEVQNFKQTMLQVVLDTERAYWDLLQARQTLLINQRLLDRTIDDRNRLVARAEFDVSPVRITEANSYVELRRADVIRSRTALRQASDALKRLINDNSLELTAETLMMPADAPPEAPISFNMIDAINNALRYRPELERALLEVNNASIRQRVADNARLPLLDLTAGVSVNGLDEDDPGQAYANISDMNYIDFLVGGRFEYPLGNRGARAGYEAARLAREQTVQDFRRLVQDRALAVKNALRNVMTAYELIGATRAARRAAADSLRAIEEQERAGVALTPEFLLDLKFRTQEQLAQAEIEEIGSLTDYNTSIAEFYESVGTLLNRYGIEFKEVGNPAPTVQPVEGKGF